MADTNQGVGLQLRSLVKASGELELSLARVPIPQPAEDEMLVRDRGDARSTRRTSACCSARPTSPPPRSRGAGDEAVVTAKIPPQLMRGLAGRVDQSLPVGNEGAGTVVDAGASAEAQALIGKTVAILRRARCTPSTAR